jgi:hypothetical protein
MPAASGHSSFSDEQLGISKMQIEQDLSARNVPRRPALATLIGAMERLPRHKRIEIVRMGRKARAAKAPRIRRLTREAAAEARRLAREAAQ